MPQEELARLGYSLNKGPRVRGVIKSTGLEEWRETGTSIEPSITPLPLRNSFKMG